MQDTASKIDEEVRSLIKKAYDRTISLVKERKEEVDAVAKRLLEKEVIGRDDLVEILGPRYLAASFYRIYRPFPEPASYIQYLGLEKDVPADTEKVQPKVSEEKRAE